MGAANEIKLSNVVEFKTESYKIHEQIQKFLSSKETKSSKRKSMDTKNAYTKDIKDFFAIIRNKEITELTLSDMNITFDDLEDFITNMRESCAYSNSTISRKISAVKSLLKYLHSKKIDNKRIVSEIDYLDGIKGMPDESERHGILTVEEVREMSNLALQEREKGEIKSLFFLLGLDTALRKEELLSLKWSDFNIGENHVIIKGLGKGNIKFRKEISIKFYNTLSTLNKGQEKVFDITGEGIRLSFDRIRAKMNFPEQRNIVIHSIRKAAINHFYQTTKDAFATMRFANHKNFNTTTRYIQEESYGALGAVSLTDDLDMEKYKKISHNDLLQAIGELDSSFLIRLNKKLDELSKK